MYGFEFRLFLRLHARALRDGMGPRVLPGPLRRVWVVAMATTFLGAQLLHRLFFLLDDLLFPGWRDQPIEEPVFIVGVPRSGTTFLHRLMARDTVRFTSLTLWEIVLAPSITQRRLLLALRAVDRALGSPTIALYRALRRRVGTRLDGIHRLDLLEPEEDELLLLMLFASPFLLMLLPYPDLVGRYARFDLDLTREERTWAMGFYRDCVRRHLFARGRGRRFLSKNPAFSGKVASLSDFFPDAAIVIPVRTPLETVPSFLSLLEAFATGMVPPAVPEVEIRDAFLETMAHFYETPVDLAEALFPRRHVVVRYPDLLADLEAQTTRIDRVVGGVPSAAYRDAVREQAPRSRAHRSGHRYSLERFGLTEEDLRARFATVMARFEF